MIIDLWSKKPVNVLLFGALLVFSLSLFPSVVWADQNEAAAAIAHAKSRMIICYDLAKEAEAVGVNITALTGILNEAGFLLSRAEFAFAVEDFAGAQHFALLSYSRLLGFISANELIVAGVSHRDRDFFVILFGSMGGTVAVLLGSAGLWSLIKNKDVDYGE